MLWKFWGIVPITAQDAKTFYEADQDSLACLMMICSNGPSLDLKEVVEKFLLAVVARFQAFKKRVPSMSSVGKRPQRSSASKGKSSVMSSFRVWRMLSSMCRLYYLRATGKAHRTQVREWMGGWSDQGL